KRPCGATAAPVRLRHTATANRPSPRRSAGSPYHDRRPRKGGQGRSGGTAMCGIVGYVGSREAEPILVEGLRRLEYRGYDSAGIATLTGAQLHVRKKAGRIADLARYLSKRPGPGCHGISHTRWATHGPASDRNAHPHVGGKNLVAVVHNGVIENYALLKRELQDEGIVFRSDTDTEVIAQLIAYYLD